MAERNAALSFTIACPKCKSPPGQRCQNYRCQNCAPHRQRKEACLKTDVARAMKPELPFDAIALLRQAKDCIALPIGQDAREEILRRIDEYLSTYGVE